MFETRLERLSGSTSGSKRKRREIPTTIRYICRSSFLLSSFISKLNIFRFVLCFAVFILIICMMMMIPSRYTPLPPPFNKWRCKLKELKMIEIAWETTKNIGNKNENNKMVSQSLWPCPCGTSEFWIRINSFEALHVAYKFS